MPQLSPRRRARQNAAFLAALAKTGNARLAARSLGVHRAAYTKRRARDPVFAAAWEKALEAAPARLRAPRPGGITPAGEAAFLAALEETGSIRRAAARAGFAHTSFLARARRRPALAREMRIRAQIAADRTLYRWMTFDHDPDPTIPVPDMTVEEALFTLYLHRPGGRFQRSVERRPRTPPRPLAELAPRIRAKLRAFERGLHWEKTGSWRLPHEPAADSSAGVKRRRG